MFNTVVNVSTGEIQEIPLSEEEIAAVEAALVDFAAEKVKYEQTKYQRQRAAEYPPMSDYLDGIVKGDQAQVQAYIDACLAVKAKYPKPE
jgi:hypothetical protein